MHFDILMLLPSTLGNLPVCFKRIVCFFNALSDVNKLDLHENVKKYDVETPNGDI